MLQKLAGRALLQHVLDTAAQLQARSAVVITGHGAQEVEAAVAQGRSADVLDLKFVRQEPQLGTGHAVQQAVPVLADDGMVVVLSGDVPLTQAAILQDLVTAAAGTRMALLTVTLDNPMGYGRIVRNAQGTVQRIVEQKMLARKNAPSTRSTAASWLCLPSSWHSGSLNSTTIMPRASTT